VEQSSGKRLTELLLAFVTVEPGTVGGRWFTPDAYNGLALCLSRRHWKARHSG
jgi:hypothetical protein